MPCQECYSAGYHAAYSAVYRASDDENHRAECGLDACLPCEAVAELAERAIRVLSAHMTEAEVEILAEVLIGVNERQLASK